MLARETRVQDAEDDAEVSMETLEQYLLSYGVSWPDPTLKTASHCCPKSLLQSLSWDIA